MRYVYLCLFLLVSGCSHVDVIEISDAGCDDAAAHDPFVVCASASDCSPGLINGRPCVAVQCDVDGVITDSHSDIAGCYLEYLNYGTSCAVPNSACAGTCVGAADGGDDYPLVCVPLQPGPACPEECTGFNAGAPCVLDGVAGKCSAGCTVAGCNPPTLPDCCTPATCVGD